MKTVKKIINDPQNVVSELLDGVVDAYHDFQLTRGLVGVSL